MVKFDFDLTRVAHTCDFALLNSWVMKMFIRMFNVYTLVNNVHPIRHEVS